MSDMRATERLLEYIAEQAQIVGQELALGNESNRATAEKALREIGIATGELRRRGDTLVRRDDLVLVVEWSKSGYGGTDDVPAVDAAVERLENAIGRKL